jgi:formate dehydrogenase subunit gamma
MIASWDALQAQAIVDRMKGEEGAHLPILHALQERFGFIPSEAIDIIADGLNLSRAEVHGVVTFYHDFRREAQPRLVVKVCRAEACQAAGGREASRVLLESAGLAWGEASRDGTLVVEPVYCLGLCAAAPAAMIGKELIAGFDGTELSAAVSEAR